MVPEPLDPRRAEGGQILVIMVLGIVTMLGMVGLIVDGGFAFAQQRAMQNAADAASNAGAVVLAERIGTTSTLGDSDVLNAISASAAANKVGSFSAYYTNVRGDLLDGAGLEVYSTDSAVAVGSGTIPPCATPDNCVNGTASGVRVFAAKSSPTFISGIVGITSIGVGTQATAVAGYLTGTCPAESGCNVLPVTIPVTVVACDGSNNPIPDPSGTQYAVNQHYIFPLCQNGPGNVGWLDWTPTAGGTSELTSSILHPDNPAMTVPSWQYVTSTGNVNSQNVEDAINSYAGEVVLMPQFDSTCSTQPAGTDLGSCPAGSVGGTGSNQWYHLPRFFAIKLDSPKAAFISGNNTAQCSSGGNGGTSCIRGTLVNFIGPGTVGPGSGTGAYPGVVGVQLVR